MSSMIVARFLPAEVIILAASTCSSVNVFSLLSASIFERSSMLESGVRSSCDTVARNSDLYLLTRAS